jgi:hypothetical protein
MERLAILGAMEDSVAVVENAPSEATSQKISSGRALAFQRRIVPDTPGIFGVLFHLVNDVLGAIEALHSSVGCIHGTEMSTARL